MQPDVVYEICRLAILMQIRSLKSIYIGPWIRLKLYTKGFSISLGHRGIGWVTIGNRGIRETLDAPIPGVYLTQEQRWDEVKGSK